MSPATPDAARLARRLRDSYLEVFPAPGIEARLETLAPGAYVAITCSPRRGIEATLALTEKLAKRQLRVVPHVSARLVLDAAQLREILARLEELAVDSVFVPAGDVAQPAGRFGSALELLRCMAEIGHRIGEVGVTAHPEGHPFLDDPTLFRALADKQRFATYMVTQMSFDTAAILRWLARVRRAGIRLPAWIGVPGAVGRAKLLRTARRIGVGESLRFLASHRSLALRLLGRRSYRPDALLRALAPRLDDPLYQIPGFHLYSFNQVEETERWRAALVAKLER